MAHNLAWILPHRYQFLKSSFCAGGSFETFENALSNFALWVDIFILALEGARAIQNFDHNELIPPWPIIALYIIFHVSGPLKLIILHCISLPQSLTSVPYICLMQRPNAACTRAPLLCRSCLCAACICLLHPTPILVPKMVLTLCNLRWWCFSFHHGGHDLLQLALVVFSLEHYRIYILMCTQRHTLHLALCGVGGLPIEFISFL